MTKTGIIKNAIEFVCNEWNNKAAGFVGHGSNAEDARAVEHLRLIAGAVQLAAVPWQVDLSP